MRLAFLPNLLPFSPVGYHRQRPASSWGLRLPPLSSWTILTTRLPRLQVEAPSSLSDLRILDQGFFFPCTTPWEKSYANYRGLVLSTRGRAGTPLPASSKYKALLWEVLEGLSSEGTPLNLNANRQRSTWGPSRSPAFTTGAAPLMYGGIRHTRYNNSSLAASRTKKTSLVGGRPRLEGGDASPDSLAPHGAGPFSPLMVSLNFSTPPRQNGNAGSPTSALGAVKPGFLPATRPLFAAFRPRMAKSDRRKELTRAIPQTRYKPGLSKAWRLLRLQFCLAWGLPWLRQRRFTNYISQLTNLTGLNFLQMCLCSVGALAKASGLITRPGGFADLLFLNGVKVTNPLLQVYKGDRLAVAKGAIYTDTRLQRLAKVAPILPMAGLEVDGLTRSITLLDDPSAKELQYLIFAKPLPFLTFRMYNWKYRH